VPWTVIEAVDKLRLIDWGVDGILTDYTSRMREVIRLRGLAQPPGVSR
jgi:glycerophosphoryl diester phosphodiesterase